MELADRGPEADGLHIGVSRHEQLPVKRLAPALSVDRAAGLPEDGEEIVLAELALAVEQQPGRRSRRLGDHANAAIADRVGGESFPSEGSDIAGRPLRRPDTGNGYQRLRERGFSFGGRGEAPQPVQQIEHRSGPQALRMRGSPAEPGSISSVIAQTSASRRSGLREDSRPEQNEHISSSRAGKLPAWEIRRCS